MSASLASNAASALDDPVELARFTRNAGDGLAESSLQLAGLHCAACAGIIEQALQGVDGVVEARVNAAAMRAQVRWDPRRTRASAFVEAVCAAGYEAVPDTAAAARTLRESEGRRLLWRLFVAAFCSMQVMMLATPSYVAAPGELASDLAALLARTEWLLSLPVLCFSAAPFFVGAWRALRRGRIGMDVPVALGIAVGFVASSGAAFDPQGPFGDAVYFDSMTMFIAFLLFGRWLEQRARGRAAETLERALAAMPQTATRLLPGGGSEVVSVQRLSPGDLVRVAVGEVFAADGVLVDGPTSADESLLSGESHAVAKHGGDALVGGSANLLAPVTMRVERVGADTRYEQIVALMRDAMTQRPALLAQADRLAGPFLWAVVVLAAGAALAWQRIDPSRALWVAVSVLIVTCPCALSLAAPSALLAATGNLARRGVLLRRLAALEALAKVQRLFVDKTGTLTDAMPVFRAAQPLIAVSAAEQQAWLEQASSLAAWSQHPLSRALCAAVPAHDAGWREVREHGGAGLEALDAQGLRWRLGSARWLGLDERDERQVYFGRVGEPLIALAFDESLRADAERAVQTLGEDGVGVTLLSGDAPERVRRVAERLGLRDAIAAATPQRKLDALRDAQRHGQCVGMVGDGINDAPVLAQADVSFAMAQGALLARLNADAVVLSNRLSDIAFARRLARRTLAVIRQNLAWAALYNAACVPLALLGKLPPWAAGLGMAASSLLVVLNALRLSRWTSSTC
jgi:Cu2+-exporting ATPase